MSDRDDIDFIDKDFSYTTEAINQILVEAKCPNKFRLYIDCLVGVANRNFEFEASDTVIAKRASGRLGGTKKYAGKEVARDKRRELLKWQAEGNLKLVDYELRPFNSATGTRPLSLYKFHLLKYAGQVVKEAQKNSYLWNIDNSKAIKLAAQNLVEEVTGKQVDTPDNKKYIDPPTEVRTRLKTAGTNLEEALKILNRHDFKLDRVIDEPLVEVIEVLIKGIKDIGYYDNLLDILVFSNIEKPDKP